MNKDDKFWERVMEDGWVMFIVKGGKELTALSIEQYFGHIH